MTETVRGYVSGFWSGSVPEVPARPLPTVFEGTDPATLEALHDALEASLSGSISDDLESTMVAAKQPSEAPSTPPRPVREQTPPGAPRRRQVQARATRGDMGSSVLLEQGKCACCGRRMYVVANPLRTTTKKHSDDELEFDDSDAQWCNACKTATVPDECKINPERTALSTVRAAVADGAYMLASLLRP